MWITEHFDLTCASSQTVWRVDAALPNRYEQLDNPSVIVCMDAPWIWGTVRDAVRIMSFAREVPEAVVVGLSFAAPSTRDYSNLRARWFTPTAFMPPPETGVRDVDASFCGHGQTTIDLIESQLLPQLKERYGDGPRWYVGHSFSALLGLNMLFSRPAMFSRWLLASPSIWWDDRTILTNEEAWADQNADLAATVWMSAGERESGLDSSYAMLENARALAETLTERHYPNLRVDFAELANESHSSTIGAAVSAGLRALHANQPQA